MTLQSGVYTPKNELTVTVWPKPDVNGDGPDLIKEYTDEGTGEYRREPVLEDGKPVRHYEPPQGFLRVPVSNPGADGRAEVYVRDNGRGQVHRNGSGEAVEIREGTALVEYADGTHKLLPDGYTMRQFELAHEQVGGNASGTVQDD